jgi:glycerol-3-phosphate acyltransferase PlsY
VPRRAPPREGVSSKNGRAGGKGVTREIGALTKILPMISVSRTSMSIVVVCCVVSNGSLDLAARAIVLQAFLFHLAIQDAATEFSVQRQMNRPRGARVIRR